VSNNYAGDVSQSDIEAPNSQARRLAAYQAWYEHTPVRLDPDPGDQPSDYTDLTVHRDVAFGSLARLFMIETRQHADPPPCRTDGSIANDDGPACDEMFRDDRSNLGDEQEDWLHGGLADSTASWNILANPLMMAGLNVGTAEAPEFTRDTWDGYPAARQRLLDAVTSSAVSNPVVVTGDWHASFVLDVKPDRAAPESDTVMPEFLASSISTILFPTDYSAVNPHVRYFVAEHGYGLVTVTPDDLTCEFHYVADVWDPDAPISHIDTWKVLDGEHRAQPA
jgi:alkaline phosphatase D